MKNIFLLMVTWLSCQICYSQTQSQHGVTLPTPTASSLATYTNIPVSIQTGVPNISYPLISVPTNNKFVEVSLGLNYHSGNVDDESWVSNVGKGWSLLGTGAISKEVISDFDESFDDINSVNYRKNEYDDQYNFSTPEESGKFRIIRDTVNNTYTVTKLTPYTSVIKYTAAANPATLIIDSFTITSSKGIVYKFQTYDINRMQVWLRDDRNHGSFYADKQYRSTYYLTSISDENNQELVKYTYFRDLIYPPGSNQYTDTEANKLTRIEIKDRGIIDINTTKGDTNNKINDPFRINNITLKTYDNRFINRYTFQYDYTDPGLRILNSFTRTDADGNALEKYQFNYGLVYSGIAGSDAISSLLLKRIILPTGGVIEYNFNYTPYSFRHEIVKNPPTSEPIGNAITFDQINGTAKKYFFTVLPNSQNTNSDLIITAENLANLRDHTWALQFYKKTGNNYSMHNAVGPALDPDPDYEVSQTRSFEPGEYYVTLFSNDFNFLLTEPVTFSAALITGPPTESMILKPLRGFARVKEIKYFDAGMSDILSAVPSRAEHYDYNRFDDPSKSSGIIVESGSINGEMANPGIVYKNVKVYRDGNTGYTKYYFKAPDDYPRQEIWTNWNLAREGILDKKEAYNASNQKVSEELYDYTFEEYDGPKYLSAPSTESYYMKTTWIRNQSSVSRNFFGSGVAEAKQEVFRSPAHYFVTLERATAFDGSIQETSYLYPLEKNNQKLLTANMTSLPLETKTMIKKDNTDAGIVMARSETKYDNPANKLPSSAVSYDSQNSLASEVIFNQYDSKGNLEEYTTRDGIPVSVVWGYNKTQPIAKIEGATYSQVSPYISDMVTRSDADTDSTSEQALQNALDLFRNKAELAGFQITTYVYDPLVGMKSMTPPSGIREIYQYDKAGRLDKITDENGNVLKKYKYNYKQ